jgi:threonine/homoserine/homoserine lactone efflux protein
MKDFIEIVTLAFTIGLTGALAPGPTLVATINSSLKKGWEAGPKVATGHALVELAIFFLIIEGLAEATREYSRVIALVGGLALIAFGFITLKSCRTATITKSSETRFANFYIAGMLTSAANPYFWIWWLSVGSALLIDGLRGGFIMACFFMIGHWSADFGWYILVSTSFHKGKAIVSQASYRKLLTLCGGFLMLFGVYYIITA